MMETITHSPTVGVRKPRLITVTDRGFPKLLGPLDKILLGVTALAAAAGVGVSGMDATLPVDIVQYGALGLVALTIWRLFFDVIPSHRDQMEQWRRDMRDDQKEYMGILKELTDRLQQSPCLLSVGSYKIVPRGHDETD